MPLIPAHERQSLVHTLSGQPELQNRNLIQMSIQEIAPHPSEGFYYRSEGKYSLRHLERFTLDLAMRGEKREKQEKGETSRPRDQETKKVHSQNDWII